MADASRQHKEMKHRVHIFLLVQAVEHGARDVAYALGDNPYDGSRGNTGYQRPEGHQHGEPHADEAESLDVGMFRQADETHDGAGNGT